MTWNQRAGGGSFTGTKETGVSDPFSVNNHNNNKTLEEGNQVWNPFKNEAETFDLAAEDEDGSSATDAADTA